MPKPFRCAALLLSATVSATASAAVPYDDAFGGAAAGPQWSTYLQGGLGLSQAGGHLNLLSTGVGDAADDALYLSAFRLSTAANFSVTIDYVLNRNALTAASNGVNGNKLGLTFGVGRDLPDGTNSAAIGVGYGNLFGAVGQASTIAYRTGTVASEVETTGNTELLGPLTGTFAIDYVSATDVLTLRRIGSTFTYSLPAGTVRGTGPAGWGATELLIGVGGRGSGLSAAAGDLYLDNFAVTGTITPEPACLTLLGTVGLTALRRRRS